MLKENKVMKRYILIFTVIGLLSCQATKTPSTSTATAVQSAKQMPVTLAEHEEEEIPVYHAAETILTDLIHTKLEVSFNWNNSTMNGKATLTAKPHFYPSDSLILDAKGMDIYEVVLNGKKLAYQYDSSFLRIQLDRTYTNKEKYTLSIQYLAKPEERKIGGSAAITSDKGLYFINPKGEDKNQMPQIWTQGETEASSVWFPTIDAPNVKTTQEIYMTIEEKYNSLSNGKFMGSTKNPNGTKTDHWKQDLPHAPYLFMMAVGEFKIVKDAYIRPDGTKMEVNYYVEPEWEPYAKAIFGETPNMIAYFSKLLGVDYAWDKYNQIVVRDYVSGAMENTGAVIFGDYANKNNRELLDDNDQSTIAHELFHHWFGDLVTCESWSNLPLNESFANYSQYLWDEYRFGIDEADYQAEGEADGYYQSAKAQGYHELIWFDYESREQMFDGHSYNKGGRILHVLRNYLGDEAFFKGLQNYLTTNKFKAAEFHQLRLAFEEVSGQDLNWFFNQYFLKAGHPVLEVSQEVSENELILNFKQTQDLSLSPIYRIPLKLAIYDGRGVTFKNINIDQKNQSLRIPIQGKLENVIVDYQQSFFGKMSEEKPQEQYIHQFYHGTRYRARRDALLFGTKISNAASNELILDALKDPFWHIRMLAIEKAVRLSNEQRTAAYALIKEMAANDPKSVVRNAAVNFISPKLEKDESMALNEMLIQKDSSYLVVSSALKQLAKIDFEKAMVHAKNLENEKSSKMALGIAQLYGNYGKKEQMSFFETIIPSSRLQGFDQLTVVSSMTYYLSKQDIEEIEKGLPLYQYLKEEGNNYTKMFIPQSCNYIVQSIDSKIRNLEEEVLKDEKTNPQYAAQNRKLIDRYKIIKEGYKRIQ